MEPERLTLSSGTAFAGRSVRKMAASSTDVEEQGEFNRDSIGMCMGIKKIML